MPELDQQMRRTGIGASEAGAVLGLDPHRDMHSVKLVKVGGLIEPPSTWRMQLGKYLEPAVAQIYCDVTRRTLRQPMFTKTYRHARCPHVLATPDGIWEQDSGGVDCKVAQFDQRFKWGTGDAEEIPDTAHLQMVVCMEVMDVERWDIALLSGDQFRVIQVHRDREFGGFVVDKLEELWLRYFEGDEWPPIGGSRITAEWLQRKYPTHRRPDLRLATVEEIQLLKEYGKVRAEQKVLAKTRATMENQLKAAIKDREGLEWSGGRFTWRKAKDSTEVDWQSMAIALRTFYIKDEEGRRKVTDDHTRIKPGLRRIYYRSDDFEEEEVDNAAA